MSKVPCSLVVTIGRTAKTIRLRNKWTQEEVAESAGLCVASISSIERCKRTTSTPVLERLAKALKVHPAVLCGGRP